MHLLSAPVGTRLDVVEGLVHRVAEGVDPVLAVR